jgi:hypothetical protein
MAPKDARAFRIIVLRITQQGGLTEIMDTGTGPGGDFFLTLAENAFLEPEDGRRAFPRRRGPDNGTEGTEAEQVNEDD